jgi:hypothetical protein
MMKMAEDVTRVACSNARHFKQQQKHPEACYSSAVLCSPAGDEVDGVWERQLLCGGFVRGRHICELLGNQRIKDVALPARKHEECFSPESDRASSLQVYDWPRIMMSEICSPGA